MESRFIAQIRILAEARPSRGAPSMEMETDLQMHGQGAHFLWHVCVHVCT